MSKITKKDRVYYTLELINKTLDSPNLTDERKVSFLIRMTNWTYLEVHKHILNLGEEIEQELANEIDAYDKEQMKEKEHNTN